MGEGRKGEKGTPGGKKEEPPKSILLTCGRKREEK